MIWARCPAALRWCAVASIDASVVTLCRGRWDATVDYAVDADPPQATRCAACELAWMRAKRVSGTSTAEPPAVIDGDISAAGAVREPATFTEGEYRANPAVAVQYAAAHGQAVVVRADGSPRVVISIPLKDLPTMPASPACPVERGLRELVENAPRVAPPGVALEWSMSEIGDEP